nr:zinc-dependent metalloprotease [Acidobacteriota bacterium]
RVMMVQPNYDYRAVSDSALERKRVTDAFARSTIWGFTVAAESDGRVLVDATDFLLRDAHGAAGRLGAGYRLDRTRSAIYMPMTKSFPTNTEMEVTTTFVNDGSGGGGRGGGQIGGRVSDVTPSPEAVTLRQHHSFIQLPDAGFVARPFDSRSSFFDVRYANYSAPLGTDMIVRTTSRHRLAKKDPRAAVSDPVKPIVYYVDAGTPDPVRSALVSGAAWWNQAFEAAGYHNAFRVELLPEGADPMDVRYNVINWVHRSTRGWSYGGSITDPRTGEIMKGHVLLGSLRIRQDYMIFEGLLSPYANGDEKPPALEATALARIRQLSAHETGHTLGLSHNYYNSAAGRISVMDYPHPLVSLQTDGSIDMTGAYAEGIGDWDKVSINWGYNDLPAGTNEKAVLDKTLNDAWTKDLRYMSNQDLDLHPRVDQWSNGVNQATELTRLLALRKTALSKFGERSIQNGRPMAAIEETLVPVYLHHRYAAQAAAATIAGQDYTYAFRGDDRIPFTWATAAQQKAAIDALMNTLGLDTLALPKTLLAKIPPRPDGFGRSRELFPRYTGGAFDALTPALVAGDMTMGFILTNDRAARMIEQKALNSALPGLEDVIDRLVATVYDAKPADGYQAEIAHGLQRVLASHLMDIASTSQMSQVRAIATYKLKMLQQRMTQRGAVVAATTGDRAHAQLLAVDIQRFLEKPGDPSARILTLPAPPPGAPIGDVGLDYLLGLAPSCDWIR